MRPKGYKCINVEKEIWTQLNQMKLDWENEGARSMTDVLRRVLNERDKNINKN